MVLHHSSELKRWFKTKQFRCLVVQAAFLSFPENLAWLLALFGFLSGFPRII